MLHVDPGLHHDSQLYLQASLDPILSEPSLRRLPSPGYPAILRVVRAISSDLSLLPWVHLALVVLAAFTWFRGLRKLGASAPLAALLTAPVIALPGLSQEYSLAAVATDTTALAFAITALGLLFGLFASPKSWPAWVALSSAVASAILVRPAYLFLLLLLPALALRKGSRALAARVLVVALLPVLGFALYRGGRVGSFSISSAGGINLFGITGQLLTEAMVSELSADLQPLAKRVLHYRSTLNWQGSPYLSAVDEHGTLSPERLRENYNFLVWSVGYLTVKELTPHDVIGGNRLFTRFGFEVIRRRPLLYTKCVLSNFVRAAEVLVASPFFRNWVLAAMALLLLTLWRVPRPDAQDGAVVTTVWQTSFSFFVVKIAEISLVEIAIPRYVLAASALLPAALLGSILLSRLASRQNRGVIG